LDNTPQFELTDEEEWTEDEKDSLLGDYSEEEKELEKEEEEKEDAAPPRPPPQKIFRLPSLSFLKGDGVPLRTQQSFEDDYSDDGYNVPWSEEALEENRRDGLKELYWHMLSMKEANEGETLRLQELLSFPGFVPSLPIFF